MGASDLIFLAAPHEFFFEETISILPILSLKQAKGSKVNLAICGLADLSLVV